MFQGEYTYETACCDLPAEFFLKRIYNTAMLYIKMMWSLRGTMWKPESHAACSLKAQGALLTLNDSGPRRVSKGLSTFEGESDAFDVFWFFISGSLGMLCCHCLLFTYVSKAKF